METRNYEKGIDLIDTVEKEYLDNPKKMESVEFLQSQIVKSRILYEKADFQQAYKTAQNFRDYLNLKERPGVFYSGLNAIILPAIFMALQKEALLEIENGTNAIKSMAENERNKIKYEISEFLCTVANFYTQFGNYEKAIEYNKECLKLREELDDKKKISYSFNNLGLVYKHFGNYKESLIALEESLKISKQYGDEYDIALSTMSLGEYYNEYGETNLALNYFDKALEFYLKINNELAISNCYLNMAKCYKRIDKLNDALELQKKSYNLRINLGSPLIISIALFEMLHIHILLKELDDASKILDELQALTIKNDIPKIKQYHTLAKALLLKESPSPRNHAKSEAFFDTVIEEPLLSYETIVIALMNKCEILITEMNEGIADEDEIVKELEATVQKSITYIEKQTIYPLLAELYWLMAQLAYIKNKTNEMDNYLAKAKAIAEEKKLYHLLTKMSLKSNIFYSKDTSMTAYFKESIKIVEQNRIDDSYVYSNDFPSKLMLFTKSGHLLYAYDFQTHESYNSIEDSMVTAFLSAINAFSQKVFAGFIDYIQIENNKIVLKYADPIFFYYVFEGEFHSAIKRLTDIVFEIKNDENIWNDLITSINNASRVINDSILKKILNVMSFPTILK